ncbi:MAG: hypothetical protein AAF907_09990, partial [Planctomycetota bacterium]
RKPARPVRRRPPATFRCPACGDALRVKGDAVGQAFDCPACDAGLLIGRDDAGEVTVRTIGEKTEKQTPIWPSALAGVGLVCSVLAGWLVLRSGAQPPEPAPEPPKIVVVEGPAVPEDPPDVATAPAEEADSEQADSPGPTPTPAETAQSPPAAELPAPRPPREPLRAPRPAITAMRPDLEAVAVRRIERRLAARVSSYRMSAPRPLGEAIEDLEDLLGIRVSIDGDSSVPVQIDRPEPLTVRELLDAFASAAGRTVQITPEGVRLIPQDGGP